MSGPLKIGYAPFENDENEYTGIIKRLLSDFGTIEAIPSAGDILRRRWFRHYDLLVFNWTENTFIDPAGNVRPKVFLKRMAELLVYRLAAKKVVFVRHNMYPHGAAPANVGRLKRMVDWYERGFHGSWVHSGHMSNKTRHYLPHPLYDVAEGDDPSWQDLNLPKHYFIIFGRLLPYKKIEQLLAVLPPEIELVVAGSCPEPAYLEKLRTFTAPNIHLIPRFISDALARKLLTGSMGMVLCNADEDMIISGSMVFAISLGVPVIAIETPFTAWFRRHVNSNMISAADDLPALVAQMGRRSAPVATADVEAAQAHFSLAAVRKQMSLSLQKLGLI